VKGRLAVLAIAGLAALALCLWWIGPWRGATAIVGEEVHLFGLVERISVDPEPIYGEPALRIHTVALGGEERVVAPLLPPATMTWKDVEVPEEATLAFGVGSLPEGWGPRPSFAIEIEVDGERLLDRSFQREAFPAGGSWKAVEFALPPGRHEIRVRARAERPAASLLEAVLLADPTLRGRGREEALPDEAGGILVLLVDTLRADRLGYEGCPRPTSPVLDRVAADAVRFRNAYAPSSWTKPSVASLFTGLLPDRHRVTTSLSALPEGAPTLAEAAGAAGFATGAFVNNPLLTKPIFKFDRGFETFLAVDARARGVLDLALAWIEEHRGEPFFLYVHLFDPHEPYDPPGSYRERFVREVVPGGLPETISPELDQELRLALYDGEIASLDAAVGGFLERLARLGLADRTTIVFASDHGEEFREHGGERHGHSVYQEVVRVPLFVRGRRGLGLRPRDVDTPAGIEDVFPTLGRLFGLSVPEGIDGADLLRFVRREERGDGPDRGRVRFFETDLFQRRAFAVLREGWKLIDSVRLEGGAPSEELYFLPRDTGERANRIEEERDRAEELRRLLSARRSVYGRDVWHLSFRSPSTPAVFSGWIETSGAILDVRGEAGADWAPIETTILGVRTQFRIEAVGTTASLAFRLAEDADRLRIHLETGEGPLRPEDVRLGGGDRRAERDPLDLARGDADSTVFLLDPAPPAPGRPACRVWRFDPPALSAEDLSPEDLALFRALGYVK
jgi:arylsulfatase A-like enzyme